MTGGAWFPFYVPVNDVDVFDLSGDGRNCQVSALPEVVNEHEMAKINGIPIYCGGTPLNSAVYGKLTPFWYP